MQEGREPLPRCDQCGMNIPAENIFKQRQTDNYNKVTEKRLWKIDVEMIARCGEMEFSMEGG